VKSPARSPGKLLKDKATFYFPLPRCPGKNNLARSPSKILNGAATS
jgi:hypothetical protein